MSWKLHFIEESWWAAGITHIPQNTGPLLHSPVSLQKKKEHLHAIIKSQLPDYTNNNDNVILTKQRTFKHKTTNSQLLLLFSMLSVTVPLTPLSLSLSPSNPNRSRQVVHLESGSSWGYFLLKGSFSLLLSPSAAHTGIFSVSLIKLKSTV